jgi:alpha-beta hydrolase superfamily lysophospholipase
VISHGAGEHSGRYGNVVERLVPAGWAIYALDHRGHGQSEGPRALIDRFAHAVDDMRALVALASSEHGATPVLLGHSLGGALALAYATRHQSDLAGLVLSAPVATLEAGSPILRAIARTLSALTPRLGIYKVDSTLISRDPEVVRAYDADPLVHHGKLPARTLGELASEVALFPRTAAGLTLPMLVMHGGDDQIAPPSGSELVHATATSADKTLRIYDGLYHEIFNEPERARVIDDLQEWLAARQASALARP